MIRIKNLRAGSVFITDAGLKFLPGQVLPVESISPQTQKLIDKGYVAKMDSAPEAKTQKEKPQEQLPSIPKEYEDLHAHEAIDYIEKVAEPRLLRAILINEPRKTVKEAIDQRLKELEG